MKPVEVRKVSKVSFLLSLSYSEEKKGKDGSERHLWHLCHPVGSGWGWGAAPLVVVQAADSQPSQPDRQPRSPKAPVPRLALTVAEAAESLGVSQDYFTNHIAPELRIVRRGRKRLIAVTELDHWLEQNAQLALGPDMGVSR